MGQPLGTNVATSSTDLPTSHQKQKSAPDLSRNNSPISSSAHFDAGVRGPAPRKSIWRQVPLTSWLLGATCVAGFVAIRNYQIAHLQNEAFSTGYILAAICVCLAMLGVRKRMVGSPIAPVTLGPVRVWQRVHHWLGCLCLFSYLLHAGFWPHGWLDFALAMLFWTVLLSGFVSWFINKTSPKLLQAAGKAVLLSDVDLFKRELREDAYRLALKCAGDGSSSALADLYRSKLADYFQWERGVLYRISPNGKKRRMLLGEIELLDRFLDDRGRTLKQEMISLVKRRDDLDFQLAIQNRMKFWAAFHQCWLGAFVVLAIAHVTLAHLYSSHW